MAPKDRLVAPAWGVCIRVGLRVRVEVWDRVIYYIYISVLMYRESAKKIGDVMYGDWNGEFQI